MRPRGDVREVMGLCVAELAATCGAVSARQLIQAAQAAQVGHDAARMTLWNMVRAGELVVVGKFKSEDSMRWQKLYEPAAPLPTDTPQPWGGIEALAEVMRTFPAGD